METMPPAWLRLAFRPLFLLGALFSAIALALWGGVLHGLAFVPYGGSLFWHAHEMVFGFVCAIVAGFLLTAVQNWTGVPGIKGGRLLALVSLWAAGRLLMALNGPALVTAMVDLGFLLAVAGSMAASVLAVKQYRNLMFVPVLLIMALGNGLAHLGIHTNDYGLALQGVYLAAWLVLLIMTILGGRVLPMFTANGSGTARVNNLPAIEMPLIAFTLLLVLSQGSGLAKLLPPWLNGLLALALALLYLARLLRLRFRVTLRVPLLWSLHLAFYFIPLMLLLLAWHYLAPVGLAPISYSTALHGLFAGAMGSMILAMMARVALGHSGRPLQPRPLMSLAFAAAILAGLTRVLGVWLWPQFSPLLHLAIVLWLLAYGLFAWCYWPVLTRPRVDGKPG